MALDVPSSLLPETLSSGSGADASVCGSALGPVCFVLVDGQTLADLVSSSYRLSANRVDCAGILKLRNSDIELRKGETDIGRKNTRVRMVFRIHINQATGRTLSLQAASNPIECCEYTSSRLASPLDPYRVRREGARVQREGDEVHSCTAGAARAAWVEIQPRPGCSAQRSAQELPLVDKQNLETCPAHGGERMRLDGHNFQHDSKVVFVEKAQDGHHLWETEAKLEKDASKPNSLVVEIPPYRNQRLSTPVHVNFYVCNGKRKRSQYQHFTYVPASVPTIKTEPHDDYDAPLVCSTVSLHPKPYFPPQVMTPMMTSDLRSCVVGGAYPVSQERLAAKPASLPSSSSPSTSPKLHDLSPSHFTKCLPAGPQGPQSPVPHVSIIQETPGRYQLPSLYPPSSSSSSSSPTSLPSTPTDAPFSPTRCLTPARPGSAAPARTPSRGPRRRREGGPRCRRTAAPPRWPSASSRNHRSWTRCTSMTSTRSSGTTCRASRCTATRSFLRPHATDSKNNARATACRKQLRETEEEQM
ncbi:unnamed protein product [Pleuronectes platessa]|uniref:RHD domain-containing protein n=1 Tax=Pleuronectes platessa TaxID=8262 RepID=A0A9N7VCR0_PLEPL|nr:unnamed protein product [Pleuronectes platessa]